MNETVTNAATCVATIVNGPQGKLAIVCGTVVILYNNVHSVSSIQFFALAYTV